MRPIHAIAREIRETWPEPYFGAVPYLEAMELISGPGDPFGADSADTILLYFLSNAKTWRGDDARRIKAEIKALL